MYLLERVYELILNNASQEASFICILLRYSILVFSRHLLTIFDTIKGF